MSLECIKLACWGAGLLVFNLVPWPATAQPDKHNRQHKAPSRIQIGQRPYDLIDAMDESALKRKLKRCGSGPFAASEFSIGHRGAPLRFPEHTAESYLAAAAMGAGVIECDVTFTGDRQLVCRHAQCDLHRTTDILLRPELAAKCSEPFVPAQFDGNGKLLKPAAVRCCTSDITLKEFLSLCGRMDTSNASAVRVDEYLSSAQDRRTDRHNACATLLSHRDGIRLLKRIGVKMIPELKAPSVAMPYQGEYTQEDYAQQMIDEYKDAHVPPDHVRPQSFNLDDLRYWIRQEPDFGKQAIFLDGRYDDPHFDHTRPDTWQPDMEELAAMGINTIAPPFWMLLGLDRNGKIRPSPYAKRAKAAGLNIIAWTVERSGRLEQGGGWYYQTLNGSDNAQGKGVIDNDGDVFVVLDALAQKVGVNGVFSDWPATVTYYANCMDPLDEGLGPAEPNNQTTTRPH